MDVKVIIFVFASILPFYSHGQNSKEMELLVGRYLDDPSSGTKHELNLYADTTFVYLIIEGMINNTVSGKWCLERKEVVLMPKKTESYHVNKPCYFCQNKAFIKVNDENGDELNLSAVDVYEQGRLIKSGFIDSLDFSEMSFDSLKINQVGYQSYWLVPEGKTGLVYEIYLKSEAAQMMERKRVLKIKKKNLVTESGLVLKRQF